MIRRLAIIFFFFSFWISQTLPAKAGQPAMPSFFTDESSESLEMCQNSFLSLLSQYNTVISERDSLSRKVEELQKQVNQLTAFSEQKDREIESMRREIEQPQPQKVEVTKQTNKLNIIPIIVWAILIVIALLLLALYLIQSRRK